MSSKVAVSMADQRRRKNRLLVLEVIKVLRAMGGAGHADTITEGVASCRRSQGREAPATLRTQVRDVLHLFESAGDDCAVDQPLFYRPFGPTSHRWSLRHGAVSPDLSPHVIEEVEAILSLPASPSFSCERIEASRSRLLSMLSEGARTAPVDLMVLDELAQRAGSSQRRARP